MSVKEKIGIVVSEKMQKTAVVKIESRFPHPIYSKIVVKTLIKSKETNYLTSGSKNTSDRINLVEVV